MPCHWRRGLNSPSDDEFVHLQPTDPHVLNRKPVNRQKADGQSADGECACGQGSDRYGTQRNCGHESLLLTRHP